MNMMDRIGGKRHELWRWVGFIRDAVVISGGPLLNPVRVKEAITFWGFSSLHLTTFSF